MKTALLLFLVPPIGLAVFRVLTARGRPRAVAVAVAVPVALVLTVVPAYALRLKPLRGHPTDTPDSPVFVDTTPGFELQVAFGDGWSEATRAGDQTVRRFTGRSDLAVGPLVSRRPASTLTFQASTPTPTTLTIRLQKRAVRLARVGAHPTDIAVHVPAGNGPAVLDFSVESGGVVTVPLGNIRATVRDGG